MARFRTGGISLARSGSRGTRADREVCPTWPQTILWTRPGPAASIAATMAPLLTTCPCHSLAGRQSADHENRWSAPLGSVSRNLTDKLKHVPPMAGQILVRCKGMCGVDIIPLPLILELLDIGSDGGSSVA